MTKTIAQERADWLLDGVACATQNRMFLRGDSEYDEIAGEAILANGEKAINVAIAKVLSETNCITEAESCVVEAAMDWAELKQGSQYGTFPKSYSKKVYENLMNACADLASECDGEPWRNPYA